MTWKVEYNSQLGFIEIALSGNVSGSDMRESASQAISLSHEHGVTEFLVDASKQEKADTITDIHELPQQYAEEGADPVSRVAYIRPISPDQQEIAQFYENVCVNRGWRLRSFTNYRNAIQWLLPP